jgi:hypothetical protein
VPGDSPIVTFSNKGNTLHNRRSVTEQLPPAVRPSHLPPDIGRPPI